MEGISYFMILYFDFFQQKKTPITKTLVQDTGPARCGWDWWIGLGNPAPHVFFACGPFHQKHEMIH